MTLISIWHSYPLAFTPSPAPATPQTGRAALSSHENPSGGTLVLGHASLLTAFLLSPNERFIVTADRDEHIRVSWFPQGYSIEMYCLGHTRYVLPSSPTPIPLCVAWTWAWAWTWTWC